MNRLTTKEDILNLLSASTSSMALGAAIETGLFLKSVVMVKVVDERMQRFFSDQLPYRLESLDRTARTEKIIEPEVLPYALAEVFQMPEDSISAAFSWIQEPPVEIIEQNANLFMDLERNTQ